MGRAKKTYGEKPRGIALVSDYQKVFGSVPGKKVLRDLMKNHHMLSSTLVGVKSMEQVLVKEGERNVVIGIMDKLKIDVAKLDKLIDEQKKEEDEIYGDS